MRYLLIFGLLFLVGCEGKKPLTTPDRNIMCPVCAQSAKLISFNEHESKYECEIHEIELNRINGEVKEVRVRYIPPQIGN